VVGRRIYMNTLLRTTRNIPNVEISISYDVHCALKVAL
jgi:hypothetical protein